MNTQAPAKKFTTAFWVHGKYKAKCGISGQIAGKPYSYNAQTKQVFQKVNGSWVAMNEAECDKGRYNIKEVLVREYHKFFDIPYQSMRRAKAKAHSLNATRQANSRRI